MGLRFRKSLRLVPGLRLNLSKRGASLSVGGKGVTANLGSRGVRTTVGIPGTGLSYTTRPAASSVGVWLLVAVAVGIAIFLFV